MAENKELCAKEVAARLRVNIDTARRLLASKALPGVKKGKSWFVNAADLDEALRYRAS